MRRHGVRSLADATTPHNQRFDLLESTAVSTPVTDRELNFATQNRATPVKLIDVNVCDGSRTQSPNSTLAGFINRCVELRPKQLLDFDRGTYGLEGFGGFVGLFAPYSLQYRFGGIVDEFLSFLQPEVRKTPNFFDDLNLLFSDLY